MLKKSDYNVNSLCNLVEKTSKICMLYLSGATITELHKSFNVSVTVIYRMLKENGIDYQTRKFFDTESDFHYGYEDEFSKEEMVEDGEEVVEQLTEENELFVEEKNEDLEVNEEQNDENSSSGNDDSRVYAGDFSESEGSDVVVLDNVEAEEKVTEVFEEFEEETTETVSDLPQESVLEEIVEPVVETETEEVLVIAEETNEVETVENIVQEEQVIETQVEDNNEVVQTENEVVEVQSEEVKQPKKRGRRRLSDMTEEEIAAMRERQAAKKAEKERLAQEAMENENSLDSTEEITEVEEDVTETNALEEKLDFVTETVDFEDEIIEEIKEEIPAEVKILNDFNAVIEEEIAQVPREERNNFHYLENVDDDDFEENDDTEFVETETEYIEEDVEFFEENPYEDEECDEVLEEVVFDNCVDETLEIKETTECSDREELVETIEELFETPVKEESKELNGSDVFLDIVDGVIQGMTDEVSNILGENEENAEEKTTEETVEEDATKENNDTTNVEETKPTSEFNIPYDDALAVKSFEILIKNLLEEKGINYKFLKIDRRIKFTFDDVDYAVILPNLLLINEVEHNFNNSLEILYKLNSILNFENFDALIDNIHFHSKLKDNAEINNIQVRILLPNRQQTLWYESCYVDLEGAILDLTIYTRRYVFALEEDQIEIKYLGEKTKNMKFNTSITEDERLRRNLVLTDESFEMTKDAYVSVYRDGEVIEKIRTCEILDYIKENIYCE